MLIIKQIARELIPPIVHKTSSYLARSFKNDEKRKDKILDTANIDPVRLSYSTGKTAFNIPINKFRYHGGIAYTYEQHHFMQYYRNGASALKHFYDKHQPKNIFEKHYLKAPNKQNIPVGGSYEEPWLYGVPWLYTYKGNHNWDNDVISKHGEQAFGPVSEQKLRLEKNRLDYVLNSIKKTGFRPYGSDGYPRGYFLMDLNGEWVFLLGAGLHRVAAMVHLGYKAIPVQFKQFFPRLIKLSDCAEWPMVKEGCITKDEAISIFMKYMKEVPVQNDKDEAVDEFSMP